MENEQLVGKRFGSFLIDTICYIDVDSFSKLRLANIIHFLNYHKYVVYHGGCICNGILI
jgi:CMP-N-acetylneuraminic acid synthetase